MTGGGRAAWEAVESVVVLGIETGSGTGTVSGTGAGAGTGVERALVGGRTAWAVVCTESVTLVAMTSALSVAALDVWGEAGTATEPGSGTETELGSGTGAGQDSGTGLGFGTETVTGLGFETGTGPGSEKEASAQGSESGPGFQTGFEGGVFLGGMIGLEADFGLRFWTENGNEFGSEFWTEGEADFVLRF